MLGYTESTVGALLGHAAHSVTRQYIHNPDELLVRAADRISNVIAKAMQGHGIEKKLEDEWPSTSGRRHLSIAA